jgi:hypothetical protein
VYIDDCITVLLSVCTALGTGVLARIFSYQPPEGMQLSLWANGYFLSESLKKTVRRR